MEKKERIANIRHTMIMLLLFFFVLFFFFDFYYDLNDDTLIKDILSGRYTGTPDGKNVQMLYPIGALIAGMYRLIRFIPWYGIFLCGTIFSCMFMIGKRLIKNTKNIAEKYILLFFVVLFFGAVFLWEIIMIQYTVISAMLAATSCFLLLTQERNLPIKKFFKRNIITILFVLLSFMIRTEMLLLMTPFIALAGLFSWSKEKDILKKETIIKYLGMISILVLSCGASVLIHTVAYNSMEWKEFLAFFDARTKVYDFTWYPEEYTKDLKISESQYELIKSYNFSLDETIDSKMLFQIADYMEKHAENESALSKLIRATKEYRYHLMHFTDKPYTILVFMFYATLLIVGFLQKDKSLFWKIPMMGIFRSVPWIYVIYHNRVPIRISHSLYMIEMLVLIALIYTYMVDKDSNKKGNKVTIFLWGMILCVVLPYSVKSVKIEQNQRETINESYKEFISYAKNQENAYFFMDVYTSVYFTEKIFTEVDNSSRNFDILGGWGAKSPLSKQHLMQYNIEENNIDEELISSDFVYFVTSKERNLDFLKLYYASKGIEITLEEIEQVGSKNPLMIYKIKREN